MGPFHSAGMAEIQRNSPSQAAGAEPVAPELVLWLEVELEVELEEVVDEELEVGFELVVGAASLVEGVGVFCEELVVALAEELKGECGSSSPQPLTTNDSVKPRSIPTVVAR